MTSQSLANAGRGVLDYFAPSIAVVFLFIGGGLGMRSLGVRRVFIDGAAYASPPGSGPRLATAAPSGHSRCKKCHD